MQTGGTSMDTTGCSCFLPRPVTECPSQGTAWKQVWFDLNDDLGNTLLLSADLASFLGEDVSDEWIYAPCPMHP